MHIAARGLDTTPPHICCNIWNVFAGARNKLPCSKRHVEIDTVLQGNPLDPKMAVVEIQSKMFVIRMLN